MVKLPNQSGDLSKLSPEELAAAYAENVRAQEATEHVAKVNRLARRQSGIVQELRARGQERTVFERLAAHSHATVRAWAKSHLDWLDRPKPEMAPEPPPIRSLRSEITWQCDHPPPKALARDEIAERLQQSLPKACGRLIELASPAIGLWPQRRTEIAATASRFGGVPLAPPGWRWPIVEDEPLVFIGQINFAELHGLPAAEVLPRSGLLAFFADYEAVVGAFPFGSRCVFYWPDVDSLVAAKARIDPIEVFLSCAIVPRSIVDLPHPSSRVVSDFGLNEREQKAYAGLWLEVRDHGIPGDCAGYADFSKILGWPGLVQSDLQRFHSNDDARLLLQVDSYCNGEEWHAWGPGGSLYYTLSERNLRARAFRALRIGGSIYIISNRRLGD